LFQHTAARRRLVNFIFIRVAINRFNTQPPEGGWVMVNQVARLMVSFNTQPPEGGWGGNGSGNGQSGGFNTQPPEGGWGL